MTTANSNEEHWLSSLLLESNKKKMGNILKYNLKIMPNLGENMDISFIHNNEKFNYRVCAVIINDNNILAMKDERSPYYYLPGGRVMMGETAEEAVIREVKEELKIKVSIDRPLWLNQSFFTEDGDHLQYHEICIYFLINIEDTILLERGNKFYLQEDVHFHQFEWLKFDSLKDLYFYPLFLKEEIYNLPEVFTLRTDME
ncbi:NUDIX hydrolase [Facklamia lactis]|uniref:NUDIX hydrolase n=1 Tax=Facklamia lactis TaxID=2749967 RepID=UPI001F35D442|nr:NUDIX domain-containing protein [Facklamia lactis]